MKAATQVQAAPSGWSSRPSVVLDTNAVLDLWAFQDPGAQRLRQALEAGLLDWCADLGMRSELQAVLWRGLACRVAPSIEAVLAQWDRHARPVDRCASPSAAGLRCRDPDDQPFLDLALQESAQWLLTSDRDLLALRTRARRHGLEICRPREWPGT